MPDTDRGDDRTPKNPDAAAPEVPVSSADGWTEWLSVSLGRIIYYMERYRRDFFEKELADFEINSPDVAMLIYLWEGNVGATQIEIARNIGVDPATVTRGLQRLEDLEIVTRKTSPDDGRALEVHLTEKGWSLSAPVLDISKRYHDLMTEGMPEEEVDKMRSAFRCMLVRVHDYCEPDTDPSEPSPVDRYRGTCPE